MYLVRMLTREPEDPGPSRVSITLGTSLGPGEYYRRTPFWDVDALPAGVRRSAAHKSLGEEFGMRCDGCDGSCANPDLHLQYGTDELVFCSFECLISYSVKRIRQRIDAHNRRLRILARQHMQCSSVGASPHAERRFQPGRRR